MMTWPFNAGFVQDLPELCSGEISITEGLRFCRSFAGPRTIMPKVALPVVAIAARDHCAAKGATMQPRSAAPHEFGLLPEPFGDEAGSLAAEAQRALRRLGERVGPDSR